MTAVPIHWIDSSVFIEAKNGPYRFNVVGVFWAFLDSQIAGGTIRCPKLVYDEIVTNETATDELAKWVKARRRSGLFVPPGRDVQTAMGTVADYVQANCESHHAADFLRGADPWLIAHALHTDGIVVTHESKRPTGVRKGRIRIPQVGGALGVRCINMYDMLEALGADFRATGHKQGR
jgi:hypothetical protein